MDFKDSILQFASRVEKLCPQIQTEEATKNALIMPFLQLLGYDVFNPFEVNPEFIADLGIKKGEKVDYAIMLEGVPILLVECKHFSEKLDPHNSQLFRYFHTTPAKFGLLTNGLNYRFYTDLVAPNKMDEKPFFEFKITEIKDNEILELKKFHKSYFNIDDITNTASELKFMNEIKSLINTEISAPSQDFVRYFTKQVYPGQVNQRVLDQFTSITKRAFGTILSDSINDRLKTALKSDVGIEEIEEVTIPSSNVETTPEEIDAFLIVKAILRKKIDAGRLVIRDNQSYCAILLDDNNRRTICRLSLGSKKKSIDLPISETKYNKFDIKSIDEIYNLSDDLLATLDIVLARIK